MKKLLEETLDAKLKLLEETLLEKIETDINDLKEQAVAQQLAITRLEKPGPSSAPTKAQVEHDDDDISSQDGDRIKIKDPAEADKLTKIQRDFDETETILHKTIESVLQTGEQLDSLIAKSSDLRAASQMFYKQAKKTNFCCTIL